MLYANAAKKTPDQLTLQDISNPAVVEYMKQFNRSVDRYAPDTLILNSLIFRGPDYGHFFFISEDNLVKLYKGLEPVQTSGGTKPTPIKQRMVMIYPKEGAIAHTHPAAIVQAPWVSDEQAEGARRWIEFLREPQQQQAFNDLGFRTAVPSANSTISPLYGLDPQTPPKEAKTTGVDPAVAEAMVLAGPEVKKPSAVTFVLDVSPTMVNKLERAKTVLCGTTGKPILANLSAGTHIGLITFADTIRNRTEVAPLSEIGGRICDEVRRTRLEGGGSALFDALKAAIQLTDSVAAREGLNPAVVVLTDGRARLGEPLHKLVGMHSEEDAPIVFCEGFVPPAGCQDANGKTVSMEKVQDAALAIETHQPVQLFFVGIGSDVNWEVCRILMEASLSQCKTSEDSAVKDIFLALGKYHWEQ